MYKIGECIIYGASGVCVVEHVGESTLHRDDRQYYVLRPIHAVGGESKIITPVDNTRVNMRSLMSENEVESLIESLPEISFLKIENERDRRDIYKEAMMSVDPQKWASILKTIERRKAHFAKIKKRVTETDLEYETLAKRSLHGEISTVLDLPFEGVEEYISSKLVKS